MPTDEFGTSFYGQHEDERILYEVHPHPVVLQLKLVQIALAVLVIIAGFYLLSRTADFIAGPALLMGLILAVLVGGVGYMWLVSAEKKNVAYITDRRVVRFKAVSPFTTHSRSLSWDEAVKVKTFSHNFLFKMFNIGTVIVHAQTTMMASNNSEQFSTNLVTDDDVELDEVYYYQDLGNYIDKILHLYKKKPDELEKVRPFVPKPKGKRY